MKITVDFNMFRSVFIAYDRADNFTAEGLEALFNYLEEQEADTGDELELDVIALCCNFAEYSSAVEAAEDYSFDFSGYENEEEKEEAALNFLEENTVFVEFEDGVIIQNF